MDFEIIKKEQLQICGLSVELINSQKENYRIIRKHWTRFNADLRNRKIVQGQNWEKFGVTIKKPDSYFYLTAIPHSNEIPGFESIELPAGDYACFQHIGSMELIKTSINTIYKQVVPVSDLKINPERTVIHYEYYNHRFHWNRNNSTIDIFLPLF